MLIKQLNMLDGIRILILEEHWFYVASMKKRVFSQFADIDAEADTATEAIWEKLISQPAGEDEADLGGMAEEARDAGLAHYEMLVFLKRELFLGGLAGMYQLWERTLRSFIEREMRHWMGAEAKDRAWKPNIDVILQLLASFGWDVRRKPFFEQLDACRLVVNAHKHGKGPALNQLAAKFPEYLKKISPDLDKLLGDLQPDHDDVFVSEDQFMAFAGVIGDFWKGFPKELRVGEQ